MTTSELLRSVCCAASVLPIDAQGYRCTACGQLMPETSGIVRALPGTWDDEDGVRQRTADSFAYEWRRFGALREDWRKNFLDYMHPLAPGWFDGKLVLDVGTGSGRHANEAHLHGAAVVAVDAGDAIAVARENLPEEVVCIQADAERLPVADAAFDLVMSIGVLHHLPDTERALRTLVPKAKPGGRVHVYLYWWPPIGWHRRVLRAVTAVRSITTRLPHPVLHALCYPLAAVLYGGIVLPYRHLRRRPRGRRLAAQLPLKTYADYPFIVCVNDQFDRFSAPLERRFERAEVERMLTDAGLVDVVVTAHHGWIADGTRPAA